MRLQPFAHGGWIVRAVIKCAGYHRDGPIYTKLPYFLMYQNAYTDRCVLMMRRDHGDIMGDWEQWHGTLNILRHMGCWQDVRSLSYHYPLGHRPKPKRHQAHQPHLLLKQKFSQTG